MVLGIRTKSRKGTSVHVDYIVRVHEIKPWPPSQSLMSVRSVLLEWENGDRNPGSTSPVTPSVGAGVGNGKIEFNESFKLPITLSKEASIRGGTTDVFQKNTIDLNLYELRRDKTVKGQLLGSVTLDLAEYGVIKEEVNISAPMNCKRSFRNIAQPILFIDIRPYDKNNKSASSKETGSESQVDDSKESVSVTMSEEASEEAEIASFTDDDISSHSSVNVSSFALEDNSDCVSQNDSVRQVQGEGFKEEQLSSSRRGKENKEYVLAQKVLESDTNGGNKMKLDSRHSVIEENNVQGFQDDSIEPEIQQISKPILAKTIFSEDNDDMVVPKGGLSHPRSVLEEGEEDNEKLGHNSGDETIEALHCGSIKPTSLNETGSVIHKNKGDSFYEIIDAKNPIFAIENCKEERIVKLSGKNKDANDLPTKNHSSSTNINIVSQDPLRKSYMCTDEELAFSRRGVLKSTADRPRNMDVSVSSQNNSEESIAYTHENKFKTGTKETNALDVNTYNGRLSKELPSLTSSSNFKRESQNSISEAKIHRLESRMDMLEQELAEAGALEISLYSVVAEHGSSMQKVHAPARRLSRFYIHACREWPVTRRASAARSAIAGLILVSKACGNDVPRLTFWLSNAVTLRAIVTQSFEDSNLQLHSSVESNIQISADRKKNNKTLGWESTGKKLKHFDSIQSFNDWKDPESFLTMLEKTEAWIFSRIVESVWWQTFTPQMQAAYMGGDVHDKKTESRKNYGRTSISMNHQDGSLSINLWKKAFKNACERICPVRAGGHECGCSPLLATLVMKECVARLDVAMFNAILRESGDEIPTDPVSDPISDCRVLPIPSGKASFGAGAQLKNAIGNWTRWLTDLFDTDEEDTPGDENECDGQKKDPVMSFKPFRLLHALSDLFMLPKDMLLDNLVRKEVCSTFGVPLIKQALTNFVPDEFCPDPIPDGLLAALDNEDEEEIHQESIREFPCSASPINYLPPSAASISSTMSNSSNQSPLSRTRSILLQKHHTSDDELDQLDSPLTSIVTNNKIAPPRRSDGIEKSKNPIRYQLLKEVWRSSN